MARSLVRIGAPVLAILVVLTAAAYLAPERLIGPGVEPAAVSTAPTDLPPLTRLPPQNVDPEADRKIEMLLNRRAIRGRAAGGEADEVLRAAFEQYGPGAKPALRVVAQNHSDPAVRAAAVAALDHIRREQLWVRFRAAAGTDEGAHTLFAGLMGQPGAVEWLEETDDGVLDAAEVYPRWQASLAGREATAPAAELLGFVLLGTFRDARNAPPARGLAALDPAYNPAVAKLLADEATARPFRRLVREWLGNRKWDPDVQRAAAALGATGP